MSINDYWWVGAAALVVGAVGGSWLTLSIALRRQEALPRLRSEELKKKFTSQLDQFRAGQVRAQVELDQARSAFKRQLAAAAEEPMAAVARAEERLRAAYDELDRVRRDRRATEPVDAELSDGFAATRPRTEGM